MDPQPHAQPHAQPHTTSWPSWPSWTFRGWLPFIALSGTPMGCTLLQIDESCGFATDEIEMFAKVVDNGTTVRASAHFKADNDEFRASLHLCREDTLTINGEEPLVRRYSDRIEYQLTQDIDNAEASYTFALRRDDFADVEVEVVLPPAFDITAPASEEEVSRSADFELTWEPSIEGEIMQIELDDEIGEFCLLTESGEHDYMATAGQAVDDLGRRSIPAGAIGQDDLADSDECEASFRLRRQRLVGYPDELAKGGRIEGVVERIRGFVSTP